MTQPTTAKADHVLVITDAYPGSWGRGSDITDAVRELKRSSYGKVKTGSRVLVFDCDAEAHVDDLGRVNYHALEPVGRGRVRRDNGVTIDEELESL